MKKSAILELLERSVDPEEGCKKEISKRYSDIHSINVDAIRSLICTLRFQQIKLMQTYEGLREKDRVLFERCMNVLKRNNKEKAVKYAAKISEIRRTMKFFYAVQLGIERFVIRLEGKLEIGDVDYRSDLKPIILGLRSMSKELSKTHSDVSIELENVCAVVEDKIVPYGIRD